MRVLVVLTSTDRRGAEIEGHGLGAELVERGVDAQVMALAPGTRSRGLDVPVLGAAPRSRQTLCALRREAADHDVVVAYGSATLPACALALFGTGTPFVYRSIGDPRAWVRGRFHQWRTALLMSRAAAVVTLWPGAASAVHELYRVPAHRITSIPNARSANDFHPATAAERLRARRQLGLPETAYVAAVVGSLTPEKRVEVALDAVALVPDAWLIVAGDGPERAHLQAGVAGRPELTTRVRFVGAVEPVLPVLHASDVLVSTSRTEGMPGVLVEAGLCDVPVVATNVGAVDWLFAQHAVEGLEIPAEPTPLDVASALRDLRSHHERSRATSSVCTWPAIIEQWIRELARTSAVVQ